MQTTDDPDRMLKEKEDEEIALLYGNGNPQEDSNELPPQLRSRKDCLRTSSRDAREGCAQRRARRLRCQRRPNIQCLAVTLLGMTIISLAVAVVWYSYELFNHGTEPDLIAWFSAGAFVILGFPVSMYGILGHLTSYNHPSTQIYIIRILWMVPIYSISSWLAMKFHARAVLFETIRDCYEAYVLYSFLQFLIQVLGGEEALVCLLKDKSPTRGVHMWGLQWCCEPWVMGQPVMRRDGDRVQWESPFFRYCKLGVLQYVLLKLVCAVAISIMESKDVYHEGVFDWKSGYIYVCILTNTSQCWALYCLIFFYYATKTELSPIRPVGKFLAVKALVFFTWWQSVLISVLYQMDMIPTYSDEWSSAEIAKGIQNYIICIEMFLAAVVHTIVFPHSEYSMASVRARATAMQRSAAFPQKRLGRHGRQIISDSSESHTPDSIEMQSVGDDSLDVEQGQDGTEHPGVLQALWESAWPSDLQQNTVNMMRGEYRFSSKTLLHHAVTSDPYALFSRIKDTDSR